MLSRRYHNLKYMLSVTEDRLRQQLIGLEIAGIKKRLASEMKDVKGQKQIWNKKIRVLEVDAHLDKGLSEELRELIMQSLKSLRAKVDGYRE